MDFDAAAAQATGFFLLAAIGALFLTQVFWLSRHLIGLWFEWKKPNSLDSFAELGPHRLRKHE